MCCQVCRRPLTPQPDDEMSSPIELLIGELQARRAQRKACWWQTLKLWVFALYYLTLMKYIQPQRFELARRIHQVLFQQSRAQHRQQ